MRWNVLLTIVVADFVCFTKYIKSLICEAEEAIKIVLFALLVRELEFGYRVK